MVFEKIMQAPFPWSRQRRLILPISQPSLPRLKLLCDRSPGFEKPGYDQLSLRRLRKWLH
ncbi:MAG TPA: hypothetical protein VE715_12770 [Blastocatellia bacterium]|nr:hypothetical protein [Blastocatellia bacterium]